MRLHELRAASFRGARFLVPNDEATEGRKTIEHNYPDSPWRYLEDNGKEPANFKLTMILHGPSLRRDWAALQSALTRPGPGTLRHPWWGSRRVSVMGRYTVKRDDKNAGWISVECEFGESMGSVFPALLSGIPSVVGMRAKAAVQQAFSAMQAEWETPSSVVTHESIAESVIDLVTNISDGLGAETSTARELRLRPHSKISDGEKLAEALTNVFIEPFETPEIDSEQLYTGALGAEAGALLIRARADAVLVRTTETAQRYQLLDRLAAACCAASFSVYAWAVAFRDHKTYESLQDDEEHLTDHFSRTQCTEIDRDTYAELTNVYTAASETLSDRALRVPRIDDLETWGVPLSVLCYQLYDSDERVETLMNLNQNQNPIWVEGLFDVLSDPT